MKTAREPKVVLITGGSSGFGKACVNHLADTGHIVYGTSRRASFPAHQRSSRFPLIIPMDVGNAASIEAALAYILQREGRLDVVVNNAGVGLAGAIEQTSIEEAKAQFETNFFGVHRICRSVLPVMRTQGAGLIVNIGSMGGLITVPFQGFYCASKYALESLTEALRMEVRPFGIQVTLVDPGDFKTSITANRIFATASRDEPAYTDRQSAAIDVIAKNEQNGSHPRELAVLLANIMGQRRVRPRYVIGPLFQRIAVWSKRFLPASFLEKLTMAHYRI